MIGRNRIVEAIMTIYLTSCDGAVDCAVGADRLAEIIHGDCLQSLDDLKDDTFADDFIVLTEADINEKLRIRKMINQATITINAETENLPTGFLQVRDFYILNGGTKYALNYITPAQMDQIKGS